MAIYIGGKKVQDTGGKYQAKGIPTRTQKRPKKQPGMDARSFAASGVEKRQRQFDKEKKFKDDQAAARRRMEEKFRTGRNVQKSDFIPKDGPKLREGLTSSEYGDYMRNLYKLNPQMMKQVFPVASGAIAEKIFVPTPLRIVGEGIKSLFPSGKEDSENTVVSSTTEQQLLEPREERPDIRYSQPSSAQLAFPGVMGIRRQQPSPAFPGILNALRNEPTVTPYESNQQFSFPGINPSSIRGQQVLSGFDPEDYESELEIFSTPEKDKIDLPQATKNYIDEYMQTYGRGSAPFERAKEIDDRERQEDEEPIDYRPNIPGIQSFFDIRGYQYSDTKRAQYVRDLIMNTLDRAGDISYDQTSTLPHGFLFDKGVKRKALDEGKSYMDVIRDTSFYEDVFQDVDYRTGDIPAEAFSGARTALIPEAASIIPQTFNLPTYNQGGIASLYNNSDNNRLTETNSYYGAF